MKSARKRYWLAAGLPLILAATETPRLSSRVILGALSPDGRTLVYQGIEFTAANPGELRAMTKRGRLRLVRVFHPSGKMLMSSDGGWSSEVNQRISSRSSGTWREAEDGACFDGKTEEGYLSNFCQRIFVSRDKGMIATTAFELTVASPMVTLFRIDRSAQSGE